MRAPLSGFGGKEICAVDIGYHSVKVVQVSLARKKGVVRRVIARRTGLTPSVSPEETPAYIVEALNALWKEAGIRTRSVISAIPGRAVFVRQLRIPFVSGERLDRIIRYEAKQQIPFPVDQMKIDYHVFPSAGGELEVTLVAVKRDIIEEHVGLLRSAGLLPELIDVTSLALYNLQMDQKREDRLVTAYVNIGASTTDIVIESAGVLKFMRSAPVAGNALTMALERDLGVSFEEAEELKVSQGWVSSAQPPAPPGGDPTLGGAVRDILESTLERSIVTEIRKSIDFCISQPEGLTVNQIVITGGTSRLAGIETFMEDRLGLPVSKASYESIESLDISSLDSFPEREVSSVALGLAERQVSDSGIALNFTPVWIEERKRFRARRGALLVQLLLLLVIMAATIYRAKAELYNMQRAWEHVNSIVGGGKGIKYLEDALKERSLLREQFTTLLQIEQQRGKYLSALVEISRALPGDLAWVDKIEPQPGGGIVLHGRSYTDDGIEQFINEIRKSPRFFGVKLGVGAEETARTEHIAFTITIDHIAKVPAQFAEAVKRLQRIPFLFRFEAAPTADTQGTVLRVDFYRNPDIGERVRQVIEVVETDQAVSEKVREYVIVTYDEITKERIDRYRFDVATAKKLYQGEIAWDEWAAKNRQDPNTPEAGAAPGPVPPPARL